MKIPVKTYKIVEVEEVITNLVDVPEIINRHFHTNTFQQVIDYLLTLEFVESSTYFRDFKSFISPEQGGDNTVNLHSIKTLIDDPTNSKIVIQVTWDWYKNNMTDNAIIIFRKPIQE